MAIFIIKNHEVNNFENQRICWKLSRNNSDTIKKNIAVRSIDIANEMNFTKASISIAMKRLREVCI